MIPCFNEPGLLNTLESLLHCDNSNVDSEVIVVINSAEDSLPNVIEQNRKTYIEALNFSQKYSSNKLKFYILNITDLPKKHAGVGLARKIGMDEAAERFVQINNPRGIIVCLDADCTVEKNYLKEIYNSFKPEVNAASIYYEHPLEGDKYDEKIYRAIIEYELYLRYYNLALKFAKYPYSFHTIGSSMAVRADVYMKAGGMNRRKAGEDFYFLHKIIPLGGFTEINSTKVIPSPRASDRVPFGTGKAVGKILENPNESFKVYHPQIFIDLKKFLETIPELYREDSSIKEQSECIIEFLKLNSFELKLKEIRDNVTFQQGFIKRFYNWLDGFMILKYVHFARDNFYGQMEIKKVCNDFLKLLGEEDEIYSEKELLFKFRELERK